MEIQFGERVGHGGWLSGTKLFRPEACKPGLRIFYALRIYWCFFGVFSLIFGVLGGSHFAIFQKKSIDQL